MSLTKTQTIDQITADEHGNIMYRETTRIMEDGVELSKTYHRSSLVPGSDLTGIPASVALIAQATWTPEVIAPFTVQVTQAIADQQTAINESAAKTVEATAAKQTAEQAEAAAKEAQAAAQAAATAAEAEAKRLTDALAAKAAAEKATADKAAFDAAVEARLTALEAK